ncbi:hypothetical protein [Bradyrhizobium zhanjiangense]|uniref:hypothetical protein n=1 Tax=Bradyrhizobium zhanjiangense TaxID=1325107 RepID=UPI001008BA54|nr:hypothetical protein [Bradyrhizobium zhanjiangense]
MDKPPRPGLAIRRQPVRPHYTTAEVSRDALFIGRLFNDFNARLEKAQNCASAISIGWRLFPNEEGPETGAGLAEFALFDVLLRGLFTGFQWSIGG